MCIRDRPRAGRALLHDEPGPHGRSIRGDGDADGADGRGLCLLYTSDAADERSSVDLGGRRIIKKKNRHESGVSSHRYRN